MTTGRTAAPRETGVRGCAKSRFGGFLHTPPKRCIKRVDQAFGVSEYLRCHETGILRRLLRRGGADVPQSGGTPKPPKILSRSRRTSRALEWTLSSCVWLIQPCRETPVWRQASDLRHSPRRRPHRTVRKTLPLWAPMRQPHVRGFLHRRRWDSCNPETPLWSALNSGDRNFGGLGAHPLDGRAAPVSGTTGRGGP